MNIPLPFQLLLHTKLLGQPSFHLPETPVMQHRGVGVSSGHPGVRQSCDSGRLDSGTIGVIGSVQRQQNVLVFREGCRLGVRPQRGGGNRSAHGAYPLCGR